MDKFGIFNVLSALNKLSGEGGGDLIGSLFKNAGRKNDDPAPSETPKSTPANAAPAHLTAPMLNTMREHEEFLRRVTENSKKR